MRYRQADRGLGSALSGAAVLFRPWDESGTRADATTQGHGRYQIDVEPGRYQVAAVHPSGAETPTWIRAIVTDQSHAQTLNLFLPDAELRLRVLGGAFAGEIAAYAKDLTSGADVRLNAEAPIYLASVTKVAIAAACIDLMQSSGEVNDPVRLELRHHREERRERGSTSWTDYADIGRSITVKQLLDRMIRLSDTTATDVLCERYGLDRINDRIAGWGIGGLSRVSSMVELDRRRWWLGDRAVGFLPDFAFSLYRRERGSVPVLGTQWLDQLGLPVPTPGTDVWDVYLAERHDQAPARAMGEVLERIATRSLLSEAWRSDLMLDVLAGAGPGRFRGITDGSHRIDAKGGGHHEVRNQVGLVVDTATNTPRAVVAVLTQRVEHPRDDEASESVREAGDLALQALGVDPGLRTPTARAGSIAVLSPRPGQSFEPGEAPLIRWVTNGVNGPLTLTLDGGPVRRTITRSAADDGEWHSFRLPDDLPSGALYRITVTGTDATTGNPAQASSSRFVVGGNVHVLRPSAGEPIAPGTRATIGWASSGIEGRLKLEVLREGRHHATLTTNAVDDGEWHSWTVPAGTPPGSDYRIRVASVADPAISDDSGPFRIGGSIEVLAPGPDEAIAVGSRPQIRWRTTDVVGPLRLSLVGENGRPLVITETARDDGEWHSWQVPNVPYGRGYRILVEDVGAPGVFGYSSFFQVGTLYEWLSPSAEQVPARPWAPTEYARPHYFPFGSPADLRWRRVGPETGRLRIELRRDGQRVALLSSNAIDDGEWHSWAPDQELLPASDYHLVLRAVDRADACGRSVHFSVGANIDAHIDAGVQSDLSVGDSPRIQWVTDGMSGSLTLDVVDADGSRTSRITTRARDDGLWTSWSVPSGLSGWYQIRITSNELPAVTGSTEWFKVS